MLCTSLKEQIMDQTQLQNVANQYGVSVDAVQCLWNALVRGNGTMAQFSHYELGGTGQWMLGGMTMVGDIFNYSAKSRVDGICNSLSNAARNEAQSQFAAMSSQSQFSGDSTNFMSSSSGSWWPSEFGSPNSVGSQNDLSYAYFSGPRRLVVRRQGVVTVYDTLDHQIGGVSQQQGGYDSLTFSSQYGTIRVADLPIISGDNKAPTTSEPAFTPQPAPFQEPQYQAPVGPTMAPSPAPQVRVDTPSEDPISMLERLGKLRDAGILTDDEFAKKKAEILARI